MSLEKVAAKAPPPKHLPWCMGSSKGKERFVTSPSCLITFLSSDKKPCLIHIIEISNSKPGNMPVHFKNFCMTLSMMLNYLNNMLINKVIT